MPRIITLVILIVLTSACSRTELAYRKADWLLEYYAWKAVQTSSTQRDDWQPLLQATLRQHREQELPLVIAYLDLARRSISETDDSVGAACLVDGAQLLYQRHARLAVDLAVPLLVELDAAQIRHLAEYMSQRQQEAIKVYRDPDPQRRKAARLKRITERFEKWTGKLNDSQRQHIKDSLEGIPDLSASWLTYRAQHMDKLVAMLETGTSAEALRTYLDGWWIQRDGTSAETRQSWYAARYEFIQLMDDLASTLTSKQRTTLENRLDDLREQLASFLPPAPEAVTLQLVPACTSSPD